MDERTFKKDSLFLQRYLRAAGLYHGEIDNIWGQKSRDAYNEFLEISLRIEGETFHYRSKKNIRWLLPQTQRMAVRFLNEMDMGDNLRITSGLRTYREQNLLYDQGRKNPGPIVTKAKAGQSFHNFGLAFDVSIFDGEGKYVERDRPEYSDLADRFLLRCESVLDLRGLEAGAFWKSWKDMPHYQIKLGLSIRDVRERFESGTLEV